MSSFAENKILMVKLVWKVDELQGCNEALALAKQFELYKTLT